MIPEFTQRKVPKVFISYSYDSEEQIDRVLELSNRLRKDGIDCQIDQYEQSPPKGWYLWMIEEIEEADFVLTVCTPQYLRRFRANEENGIGMGVTWEGSVITQELYSQAGKNSKYIPIIFEKHDTSSIPHMLRSSTSYNLGDSKSYKLLYRHLTNQPEIIRPELGEVHKLPVRELPIRDRIQLFTTLPKKAGVQEKEYCNLPHKTYSNFIGRQEEIAQLLARISPNYRQHISVVRGIGGVGKTALVMEVAHQCWNAKKNGNKDPDQPIFDAIIFTSSKATDLVNTQIINRPEKEPLLTDIFRVISDVLDEPTITQVLAAEQWKKVNEVLAKKTTLLIVDNMETILEDERNSMLSFLNNVPVSTQVIITSRNFLGFDSIQIDSLTEKESYNLLDMQAKAKDITINHNWKKQIYKRFNGIPIALIYAVGKRAAGYNFADIVEPKKVIAEDLGKFCFESSVTLIKKTKAYDLIMSMTFFQDPPCRDALISVAGLIDGNLDTIDGVAELQQLSLITEKRGRYSTLSLTHQYTLLELGKDENDDFKMLARERWYKWYLNFTKQYGREDWEGWRARYDRLDAEWKNIESVLNWYAEKEEWIKVLQLWQNVDNYADLSGYWQDRRYWWALLGRNFGSAETKVKALSEKGFTLTLMGTEYYELAEEYLNNAWDLCKDIDDFGRATVANYLAVLAKVKGNYDQAHKWLDREEGLLQSCETDRDREKKRYQVRNLYYRAETNYLQHKIDLAREQFEYTIVLTREIDWQRFRNYAKNILAEIYIRQDNLESAETLLRSGLSSATQAKESRRIALYHSSYAKFHYKSAQKARGDGLQEESNKFIGNAKDCASKALKVFSKELMIAEKNEITELIESLNQY
jgi:SEFIR domain/MalT-like TPR region/NB-ARC domain